MRTYLAGPLDALPSICRFAEEARAIPGVNVVSRWHYECALAGKTQDPSDAPTRIGVLNANMLDLERAEVVVALTGNGTPRGTIGDIVFALALGRPVIWSQRLSGAGGNIWDAHPSVVKVYSPDQALDELRKLARRAGEGE